MFSLYLKKIKCISSASCLVLQKVQRLSSTGIPSHLLVSIGRRWFEVLNLTSIFLNFEGKISKYFSYPKIGLKILYVWPLDELLMLFDHFCINWSGHISLGIINSFECFVIIISGNPELLYKQITSKWNWNRKLPWNI